MSTRANIHLDDEAYNFASAYAHGRGLALGAAISELLHQRAHQATDQDPTASGRLTWASNGLLVKAKTGRVITSEMVKESSEDDID